MNFIKTALLALAVLLLGCTTTVKVETPPKYSPIVRLLNNGSYSCTAFVISPTLALTAAHCVDLGMMGIPLFFDTVEIANSAGHTVTHAYVIGANTKEDYALLRGDFSAFNTVKVDLVGARTFKAKRLLSCGYPWGSEELKCSELELVGTKYFQLKAKGELIFPGHSGGPVFDLDTGVVIALNSAVDQDGVLLAPLNTVPAFFKLKYR